MRKSWQGPSRTRNCSQTRRNLQIRVCSGHVPGYVPDSVVFCYFYGCTRHPSTGPTYNTCCSAVAPPQTALLVLPGRARPWGTLPGQQRLLLDQGLAPLCQAAQRSRKVKLLGTGKGFAPAKLANCPWCVDSGTFFFCSETRYEYCDSGCS